MSRARAHRQTSNRTCSPIMFLSMFIMVTLAPFRPALAQTGPLPPGDPFDLVRDHLEWNVWLEESAPGQTIPEFKPLSNPPGIRDNAQHLKVQHEYLLVIHLSERRYPEAVFLHDDDIEIRRILADSLQRDPLSAPLVVNAQVEIDRTARLSRMSPTPLGTPTLEPIIDSMIVRQDRLLSQIRNAAIRERTMEPEGTPDPESKKPFSSLAKNKDVDFVYGQLVYRIKTGTREGMIALVLTMKRDAKQIASVGPLVLCIASEANRRRACSSPVMADKGEDPSVVKNLRWNFWTESRPTATSQPLFRPVPVVEPSKGGRLVLDLASIIYMTDSAHMFPPTSAPVSEALKKIIREWLTDRLPDVTLTIVAVPDRAFLELPGPPDQQLTIKLAKIRALLDREKIDSPDDPFEILSKEDPEWFFGRVHYPFTAKDKEGWASVAFSIWAEKDGKTRPIDEIIATFCIARAGSGCTGTAQLISGLSGVDSLKLVSEPDAPFPDAALHFVPLNNEGPVMGVFRRNDKPKGEFTVWSLDREFTADKLKTHLSDSMTAFATATTDQDLRGKGKNLYALFMPSELAEGRIARQAFETFIRDRLKPVGTATKDVPTLFVRLVGHDDLIPLGFLPIKTAETEEDFLGFRFRVETPLKVQSYRPESGCISRWAFAAPTEQHHEQALSDAWKQASSVMIKWRAGIPDPDKPGTMRGFEDWLHDLSPDQTASAIVTLSHHDRNQLWLEPKEDSAQSDAVERQFLKASLAVLNGCGTAKPGANEFIRKLNEHGVKAVIATSAEVEPAMAGDFFNCLDAALEQHKADASYTISQAYFDTIRCLKEKAPTQMDKKYGARALKYALLGNGSLKLCLPVKP